jgi:hypothetical protein
MDRLAGSAGGEGAVSDDLTARRTARTMRGVVCALSAGELEQEDLDAVDRFKRFLREVHARPGDRAALVDECNAEIAQG